VSRLILPLLAAVVLAVAGCGEEEEPQGQGAAPTETPAETAQTGCRAAREPARRESPELGRPTTRLRAGQTYVATVTTSCGEFEITLDARRAPRTGGSFLSLARRGFYDATLFHRVVPGFVIQGGDPEGTGTGGPGYSVEEAPPETLAYGKGVVAMAKTAQEAPGTSGSQFFVVTAEDAGLPPEYALLGRVTSGMEVVERIAAVPVGPEDRPEQPVVIERVTVAAT